MSNPSSSAWRSWNLNGVARDLAADLGHDPGRIRLFNAIRAVVASLVTGLVLYQFAVRSEQAIALAAPGFLISFLWVVLARETRFRGQLEMLFASSATIAATVIIVSLLRDWPSWLGALYLCVGMFLGTLVQDCLRRASGITVMWFVVTCVELYSSPSIAAVRFQMASIAIGAGITFVICILFLPHSSARVLRSALSDFQWNAARIRHNALRRSSGDDVYNKADQRAYDRLGRSIAVIESELSGQSLAHSDAFFYALARAHVEVQIVREASISAARQSGPDTQLHDEISARIAVLDDALSTLRTIADKMEIRPIVSAHKMPISIGVLAWRPAIQVTAAITMALSLAEWIVPGRWYWAVVTANAVLARSNTTTIHRSFLRLAGTVTGLIIGLLIGWLIGGNMLLACAAIFVVIFALHFYLPVNYGIGVLFATIFVGLLYASLGFSETQILLMRFEETIIGVLAAVLVATAVFPVRAASEASPAERAALNALKEVVEALAGGGDAGLAHAYLRLHVLNQRLSEAKQALRPAITVERVIGRRDTYERWRCLDDCRSWIMIALRNSNLNSCVPTSTVAHLQSLWIMLEGMIDGTYVPRGESNRTFIRRGHEEDAATQAATAEAAAALDRYWAASSGRRPRRSVPDL
ncbi:FUSC family protein [Paraburkholderia sp. EG304]|uniref:FUSC family protein n=1 Tax=Paraburkholderia sp. EG304 TaxID=3237015 RepID=UPI00397E1C0D